MFCDFSGVLTAARLGLRLSTALDRPAFLEWITFGLSRIYIWIAMAIDSSSLDSDSRRNCSTCTTRMSSLMHDSHLTCINCRGRDCDLNNRRVECEGWSEEAMLKYVKYRKSLD